MIKTMGNKMAINTYLSTIESKKQTKQTKEQKQNHGYRECFDGCQTVGVWGEKVRGLRSTTR